MLIYLVSSKEATLHHLVTWEQLQICKVSIHKCLPLNPGAYQVVGGGVLTSKNSSLSLNKVQEVWYHLYLFDTISDNVLQIFIYFLFIYSKEIYFKVKYNFTFKKYDMAQG